MMRARRFAKVVAILIPALPFLAFGADRLTVEEAVAAALAGNPEVLAAAVEVDAARGRALQFASRPDPGLTASLEGVPLPGRKQEGDETDVQLGIEQVFEFPGKRSLRAESGRIGELIASAELERVRRVVAAKVKRAYWRAVFALETVKALERSAGRLELLLGDLQARYRSGTGPYADVLRARAERARLRNQALEQERERRLAMLELNRLLSRPSGEAVEPASGMPFVPLDPAPDGSWERVRSASPSLRIAALRRDLAATALKQAEISRRPDLVAGFFLPSVRPSAWGLSLGLTLPFLRPGRTRGLSLEADAGLQGARLAMTDVERRLRARYESAYESARIAGEQVEVLQRDLIRELEDELRIQAEYFRYGKSEAYALLDLHRTFVLAEMERLRAVMLYNVALADLEVAGEEAD